MIAINYILFIISIFTIIFLLKKTNSNIFNPGPLWKLILLESFLVIFAPIIIITYPEAINVYQMKGTSYLGVISNSIIFYIQFILLLVGFCFGISKSYFTINSLASFKNDKSSQYALVLTMLVLLSIILIKVSTIPLFSAVHGGNLAIERAQVGKQLTGIYSILHTLTLILSWLLIYTSAALKNEKKHYIFYLLLGIFGLSWFGHKSSIILSLLGFYFYSIKDKKTNLIFIYKNIAIILILSILLFYIYKNSIPSNSNVMFEFLNRLFLGQLHGFYQEFEYFTSDVEYWKSWIPLSSFIFDGNINYARDLMNYTEGITATNQMKNTFIGAETHRVLGLIPSIIVMPFLGYFIIKLSFFVIKIASKFLGKPFYQPILWTLLSSLTLTNGIYTYSSFRFIYIFIASITPVILIKMLIKICITKIKVPNHD